MGDRQMRDRVGDQASIRGRVWPALEHLGGQTAKRVIGLWDKKEDLREPAAAREGHGEAGMTSDQPAHLTQPVLVEVLLRKEGINDRDVSRDARSRGRIELPAPAPNDGLGSTNGNDDRSLSGSERHRCHGGRHSEKGDNAATQERPRRLRRPVDGLPQPGLAIGDLLRSPAGARSKQRAAGVPAGTCALSAGYNVA
ncbi:MAG TPA: hypothetical protein VF788_11970 [Pseudonocardiaceae bacterium]